MTNKIEISYDPLADVLYLSIGHPERAVSHQDSSGLVWRNKIGADVPFAVTIIDFKDTWLSKRRNYLVNEIAHKLNISVSDVEENLPH
ncbi:hypothetical protein NBRC3280_3336 [Acetobacter pasteurianus NBRC 3280]|uniref:DUF2283 domain-containing protein n=2 Tax=Acetobacter pasteurianus TaxID=438 RepID=A0A1Y0YAW7_ACEPA|nr:hypothetical protein [Acetobacter pasteurianus]ARW48115.1 hypothetical protein S1001342_01792 [Acetobacter pasteurianus subsp. pasteurianus]GCD60766.1 hypothetical protein NBRC3277_3341 [Acetobacter pasteurianus NBRC 3277]GCD64348.1 hypothetical protein NBRC3278_3441 [Acetobacter pasteurianus NBRC 3278]GCD70701.1 hypothetical protein NBRC3280_3336 [Acetobacter pasteurianus NBRC 3280]